MESKRDTDGGNLRFWLWGLVFAAFVCSALWFRFDALRSGHDIFYHMLRVESLYEQLGQGVWSSPINYLFFNGMGYASSLFYPEILLYIPVFFRSLGLEIEQSMTLFLCLCMAASAFTAFRCGKELTGRQYGGAVAAVIYTLCQYKLDCLYTRGAVGEIQAFIFLPLAVAALYDLVFHGFRRPYLMVLAFSGLMLTHTITCFFAILFSAFFCLVYIRRVWPHMPRLCAAACITLGLTAFYWLPCLEMLLRMDLRAAHPWTFASDNAVPLHLLFSHIALGAHSGPPRTAGLLGTDTAGTGWELLLLCLPVLFLRRSPERTSAWLWFAAALGVTFMASDLFPWSSAGFLGIIQFPWRLYSFSSLCFALSAAWAWLGLVRHRTTAPAGFRTTPVTEAGGGGCPSASSSPRPAGTVVSECQTAGSPSPVPAGTPEFPVRSMGRAVPGSALSSPVPASRCCPSPRTGWKNVLFSGGSATVVLIAMCVAAVAHMEDIPSRYFKLEPHYFSNRAETVYVGGGEWLPEAMPLPELKERVRKCWADPESDACWRPADASGTTLPPLRSADQRYLGVSLGSSSSPYLDIPLIWYQGYAASFVPQSALPDPADGNSLSSLSPAGEKLPVVMGPHGLCRVRLDGQHDGLVIVWYAGTRIQHLAPILSLLTFLYLLWRGVKWRKFVR